MPITSIHTQPAASSIHAAYRPIVIVVNASADIDNPVPPVVYCDIYFGGVFHKTLSKTQHSQSQLGSVDSSWQFDLQDAAQEYLQKFLAPNGGNAIVEAQSVMINCYCRLRSSTKDADGFILPDGTPPVQGTGSTEPISGSGEHTNTFFILNATLQHEDNQDLIAHLASYKRATWKAGTYPLSHRPEGVHVGLNDSDYFPLLIPGDACLNTLALNYKYKGQATWRMITTSVEQPCNAVLTNLRATQTTGTQNITIRWNLGTGATGVVYRLDGGPWLAITGEVLALTSLSAGLHTFDIAPTCVCGQGAPYTIQFTIFSSFTCASTVSSLSVNQIGQGEISYSFSSSGPASNWQLLVDGNQITTTEYTTGVLSGMTIGTHTLRVIPVCSNGAAGTYTESTFVFTGVPTLTKISETSSGPGNVRTQVFRVGPAVYEGNRFVFTLYNHVVEIEAEAGDTPWTIITKIRNAINATTTTDWNEFGQAPPIGTNGYPPTATSAGATVSITIPWQSSFTYHAYIS